MSLYFTSDLHFFHDSILTLGHTRPFVTLEEMHETLIANWNKRVTPYDTIYVLGDMSFGTYKEFYPIAQRLNGKKILIQGNHDKYSISQYNKLGFEVYQELVLKLCGHRVRLSHYPYALPWYKRFTAFKSELRFMDKRPPRIKGEWLMHGHVHTKYKQIDNRLHVGVDANNYTPVSLSELESLMNTKG